MAQTLTKGARQLRAHVAQLRKDAQLRDKEIARLMCEVKNLSVLAQEQQFALVYAPRIRELLGRIAALYEEVGGGVDSLLALSETQAELISFITDDLQTPLGGLEDVPELMASLDKSRQELAVTTSTKQSSVLKKKIVDKVSKLVTMRDNAISWYVSEHMPDQSNQ